MVVTTLGLAREICRILIGGLDLDTQNCWWLDNLYLDDAPNDDKPMSLTDQTTAGNFQSNTVATINNTVSLGKINFTITNLTTSANILRMLLLEFTQAYNLITSESTIFAREKIQDFDMTSVAPNLSININIRRK